MDLNVSLRPDLEADRRPARGIIFGLLVSLAIWGAVAFAFFKTVRG